MTSRIHYNDTNKNNHPRRRRKRVRPIARVTSYDVNVQYDLRRKQDCLTGKGQSFGLFAKPLHEESYNVLEGEILMSLDKSKRYMDGNIHCFSFANGLGNDISPSVLRALASQDSDLKRRATIIARYQVLSRLTYSGIAVTPFYAERNSYQDMMQGFVSNVGGLNTLVNTGNEQIRPGDIITVDLPPNMKWDADNFNKYKKHEGIPIDKLLFATAVYRPKTATDMVYELIEALSPNFVEETPAPQLDNNAPRVNTGLNDNLINAANGELDAATGNYVTNSTNWHINQILLELSNSSNDAPALKNLATMILKAKTAFENGYNALKLGGQMSYGEEGKYHNDYRLIREKGLGVIAISQLSFEPELGLKYMLDLSHSISHLNRRLIIGTALSQARRGETFDIVLGGSVDA